MPALRHDAAHGFSHLQDHIDDCLELGVGGFLIYGGAATDVAALTHDLRLRSRIPLLLAADVERGAGQQFTGCLALPPFGALGSLDDAEVMRRAARITARELKSLGLNWAFAPVADLDIAPYSPIVGTRAIGGTPQTVATLVAEWIDACQAEGVLACVKHFPGHGRADGDSHVALPSVFAGAEDLWNTDLAPFRAAIDAGVASLMTAHVSYPSLDPSNAPATLSAPLLGELLRGVLEFDGLVVSDALEMDGVLAAGSEAEIVIAAMRAGCDVLLSPMDVSAAAQALAVASITGGIDEARLEDAVARRDRWAQWSHPHGGREASLDDVAWARQMADRAVHLVRGVFPRIEHRVEIVEVDDDAGGPWPVPARDRFAAMLHALEVEASEVPEPTPHADAPVLIALYADVIAWKGADGLSAFAQARVHEALAVARAQGREACVVLFSHPRHAEEIADAANVVCAWGGEAPMQEAAARVLMRGNAGR